MNEMRSIIDVMMKKMVEEQDNYILREVNQIIGVDVDKERLVQALADARKFWDEGFEAGRASLRPKGEWEFHNYVPMYDDMIATYQCSNCHLTNDAKSMFCPNCGADMRGESDDNR